MWGRACDSLAADESLGDVKASTQSNYRQFWGEQGLTYGEKPLKNRTFNASVKAHQTDESSKNFKNEKELSCSSFNKGLLKILYTCALFS